MLGQLDLPHTEQTGSQLVCTSFSRTTSNTTSAAGQQKQYQQETASTQPYITFEWILAILHLRLELTLDRHPDRDASTYRLATSFGAGL